MLPAINEKKQPLKENAKAFAALENTIKMAQNGKPDEVVAIENIAGEISGKAYQLSEGNPLGMKEWQFNFDGENEAFAMNIDGINVNVGLDGVYRVNPIEEVGLTMAMRGKWISEDSFQLEMQELSSINKMLYLIQFKGKSFDAELNFVPGNGNGSINFTGKYK